MLIKSKKLRFATDKEVYEVSGCLRGAVPPFGSMFARPIQTYVDRSLSSNEMINFNCGLRTHSLSMRYEDYVSVESVTKIYDFSEL